MQIENYANILGGYDFEITDLPLQEAVDWNGRKVSQRPSGKSFMSCKSKESGGGSVTIKGGGDSDGNSHLKGKIQHNCPGGPSVHAEGKIERKGGETKASGEVGVEYKY